MLIFYFDDFEDFAKGITGEDFKIANFSIEKYKDGETRTILNDDVSDEECLIIGTISPPMQNLFEVAKLAEVIMRNGAKSVSLYAPYLAFTRQSDSKIGWGSTFHLICAMLRVSGIDRILTIDPHGKVALGLSYGFPVHSIDSANIISNELHRFVENNIDTIVISPDIEYSNNAKNIADMLGLKCYTLTKIRLENGGVEMAPAEKVFPRKAIIVDDMLCSGETMLAAVRLLNMQGVKEIVIYVTHGLFIGDAWKLLFNLGVKKIITTNSVKNAVLTSNIDSRIQIISLTGMFKHLFERY